VHRFRRVNHNSGELLRQPCRNGSSLFWHEQDRAELRRTYVGVIRPSILLIPWLPAKVVYSELPNKKDKPNGTRQRSAHQNILAPIALQKSPLVVTRETWWREGTGSKIPRFDS